MTLSNAMTIFILLLAAISVTSFSILAIKDIFAAFALYIILLPFTQAGLLLRMGAFDLSPSYVLGAVLLVIWITRGYVTGKSQRFDLRGIKYPMGLLVLSSVVSTVLSPLPQLGLRETVQWIFSLAICLLAANSVNSSEHAERLIYWWFVSISLAVGISLVLFFSDLPYLPGVSITHIQGLSFEMQTGRPPKERFASGIVYRNLALGFGNNPDKLAGLALIGIFLCLSLMRRRKSQRRLAYGGALVLLVTGLLLTYTRSAWLASLIGLGYLALQAKGERWRVVLILLLLLGLLSSISPLRMRLSQTRLLLDASEYARLGSAKVLLNLVRQKPIFGVGPGVVMGLLAPMAFERGWTSAEVAEFSPHNTILQLWAEQGTVGLLAFGWLCLVVFRAGRRGMLRGTTEWQSLLSGILAAFISWNVIIFFHPEITLWYWILLGLVWGMGQAGISPGVSELKQKDLTF